MPMTDRIRMTFITRRNALKRNPMIVPDKRNRTIRLHGNDSLAVEQAYSRKQDQ